VKALVAVAAAATAAYAGWVEPRRLVTTRCTLRLPRWPPDLDGLRLGLLSDLPDAILLLGDYIDAHPLWGGRLAPEKIAHALAALHAPLGTYAVLGNHDWKQAGDRMWRALHNEGIEVHENRVMKAGDLYVAGLADLRRRRPDLPGALAGVPADAPVVLLSHDPDVFPYVPGRISLTLSGHTHGGQIAIPVLRRLAIPSRYGERYARGHVVEDGRHLYVTSGLGTSGLPLRLLSPPEVVVLELVAATT
jgi:predicted MPP superfamily phosphohydrolase